MPFDPSTAVPDEAAPQVPANAAPPDTGTLGNHLLRLGEMLGTATGKGLAATAGIPGDINELFAGGMNKLMGRTGADAKPVQIMPWPQGLNSDAVRQWGATHGLWDQPAMTPQNKGEQYLESAGEGIGAALPFAATGGLPGAARLAVSGALAGAGEQAGKDAAPGHPVAGPIIGGIAGALAGSGLAGAAGKVNNAIRGASTPVVEAYKAAGVIPRLAGDVTGNRTLQWLQATGGKLPGGAGIEKAGNATLADFGDSVENAAGQLGQAATPQQAGAFLQNSARNWMNNVAPQQHAAAWAPVDAAVPGNAQVWLKNYKAALDGIGASPGRLQNTTAALQPGLMGQLKASLGTDLGGMPATWDEVQKLRSMIGEARGTPDLVQSIGDQNLSKLYGALSDDMRTATRRIDIDNAVKGGMNRGKASLLPPSQLPVTQAFDNANAASTQLYNFQQGVLGNIVSGKNPLKETVDPGTAANRVLNSGKTGDFLLGQIRQQMPDAADQLAAYKLRSMAGIADNATGTSAVVSPAQFATALKPKNMTPEAFRALFSTPEAQARVKALNTVADSMQQTAKRLNTSNTSPATSWREILPAMMAGAGGGYATAGIPGALFGAAASPLGVMAPGLAMSGITSSPMLTSLFAAKGIPALDALGRAGQIAVPLSLALQPSPQDRSQFQAQ